jgi:hypothetical protein
VSWAREIARHLGLASGDLDEVLEPVPLGRGGDPMVPGRVALEAATRVEDDAPTRSPVVSVAVGAYHTACLTAAGHVWTSVAATIFERFRPGKQ